MTTFRIRLGILGILLLSVVPARAALDAEADKKYQVQVVLSVAEHRMLTAVFKDRLRNELHDSLQAALGDMGTVAVVTKHPLLKEIEAKGMEAALDAANGKLFKGKAHFVRVYYSDGRYRIRTRQLDGMTGMASPVIRREETTDRLYVARTAALMIGKDFGAVGTIGTNAEGTLNITLKAGKLGPASRWVKKGDVFAVVRIGSVGQQFRGEQVPWALLAAEEDPNGDGACRCRLWQRYKESLAPGSGVLGYRCIKLGTTKGHVRLRIVNEKSRQPKSAQSVRVLPTGFEGPAEEHASDADGFVVTSKEYDNIAFVQVLSGGAAILARVPLPILDDRAIVIPVNENPAAEARGQFDLHRRQWLGQLYESLLVVDNLFKQLNIHVEAKENDAALKLAQTGIGDLKTEIAGRTDERKNLLLAARELNQDNPNLAEGDQRLQEMQSRLEELRRFVDNLKLVKQAGQRRAELLVLTEQARLFEGEAEFGKAIDIYAKIAAKAADEPKLRDGAEQRRLELENNWTTRGNARVQDFTYKTWPAVDSAAKLKASIDEARAIFQICAAAGDRLTPRMLLKSNLAHATRLKKRLDSLQPKDNEDGRRETEEIIAAAQALSKFTEEISTFLRSVGKK